MIKYFHKLTEEEFDELVKQKMTWEEVAKKYQQPKWCDYPDAVCGPMGCWSLMMFLVKNKKYCRDCDCFNKRRPNYKNIQGSIFNCEIGGRDDRRIESMLWYNDYV
jgi:hypothetical protein